MKTSPGRGGPAGGAGAGADDGGTTEPLAPLARAGAARDGGSTVPLKAAGGAGEGGAAAVPGERRAEKARGGTENASLPPCTAPHPSLPLPVRGQLSALLSASALPLALPSRPASGGMARMVGN